MSRFLIADPFPSPPNRLQDYPMVIAPNAGVSRFLGVATTSLQAAAKSFLKTNGYGIATPIRAAVALRGAVGDVCSTRDVSAVAAHHREIVGAMLRSGVDLDKLASVGSGRARTAARIARRYVEILDLERLVDTDAALWSAIERQLIQPARVLIYGYFRARQLDARPEEIEFIDRLAGDGSVFCLPCGEEPIFSENRKWLDILVGRGWQVREERKCALAPEQGLAAKFAGREFEAAAGFEAIEYTDLESEVRGTLARAKAAVLDGVPVNEIAIVCRDLELYARPIIAAAREYQLPVEMDCEVAIGETVFGEFVSLLFDAIELGTDEEISANLRSAKRGFEYEPTLRLLLHRFGPGLTDDERRTAFAKRPHDLDGWRSVCARIDQLATEGDRDAAGWTQWIRALFVAWELRGAEKLASSAADVTAYERFFEALEEYSRQRAASDISIADFTSDVRDILANIKTRLHTESGGIKLLLPNVIVGSRFQEVYLVGLAEGILPAPSTDDNVIDFCERERLRGQGIHFENALEVPRWEALTFYFTLLAARDRVIFSYPRFAADRELIASAYFHRLGLDPVPAAQKFVSSREEYRRAFLTLPNGSSSDPVIEYARHQYQVEARRESDAPPDKYDGIVGIPIRRNSWSASSLARIGSCPFKWFASDLLQLRAPQEAETELAANIRGSLLHKTLEIAARQATETPDHRRLMLESLEAAFTQAEAIYESLTIVANWHLRRSEQIEMLERAIAADDFIDEGAVVLETEKAFEVEFCGLTLKGTIDRIDRLGDGRLLAVDYKHGGYVAKIKDETGYLRLEIQLPIYSLVALRELYPDYEPAGGRFFHIAEPKKTLSKEVDLEAALSRIKKLLEHGRFAVDPDLQGKACDFCEFDVVCRVGQRVALKRI